MIALLRKEWRENRWLLWAFVLLAPLLSLLLKQFLVTWERVRPDQTFAILLPVLTALYLMAIGADLVAGDAGSGRISFLAALPVRPAKIWAAKVVFLFGTAALFAGYVLAAETLIHSAAGLDLWAGFTEATAEETALHLALAATLGAAVVFWSTLIDRGLAAVFAALLTLGGFGWAAWFAALSRYEFRYATLGTAATPPLLLGGALLLGSLLAFAKGRIHLGGRLRRLALALGALLAVTAPAAATCAVRLHHWATVTPADRNVDYSGDFPVDPRGEWALVTSNRTGAGPFGASPDRKGTRALFAVRLRDGAIRDLTGLGWFREFSGPGRVRLLRPEEVPGEEERSLLLDVEVDLETGEVLHTRPDDPSIPYTRSWGRFRVLARRQGYRVLCEGREPIDLPPHWTPFGGFGPTGLVAVGPGGERVLVLVDEGRRVELPAGRWDRILLPSDPAGSALGVIRTDRGRVEILGLPLDGRGPELLAAIRSKRGRTFGGSPDGRRAFLADDERGELLLLDADEGVRRFPLPPGGVPWPRAVWAADASRCLLALGKRWLVLDPTGSEPRAREADLGLPPGRATWFDGRRALVLDDGWDDLYLAEPGAPPRRLLPARRPGPSGPKSLTPPLPPP